MKVCLDIVIPNDDFCDDCPCFLEQLDSFDYEESHNWCFYTKKDLNKEVTYDKKTKKPRSCPYIKYKLLHNVGG